MHNHSDHDDHQPKGSRFWLPLLVFAGAIGFLLFYEHRAHIPADAVFLVGFLLLCGVMHLFMHSAMGGHGGHGSHGDRRPSQLDEEDDWRTRR
ncbi:MULTISPECIES: DUF2933 domain-containing protein [Henriciella]|uniref:DUF2933 domain-containing protein n=1 Tax=Henriciella TaxID=453849 RepID=UPI000A00CCDD